MADNNNNNLPNWAKSSSDNNNAVPEDTTTLGNATRPRNAYSGVINQPRVEIDTAPKELGECAMGLHGLDLILPESKIVTAENFCKSIETREGAREIITLARALYAEGCRNLTRYIDTRPWEVDDAWYTNVPPAYMKYIGKKLSIPVPKYCTDYGKTPPKYKWKGTGWEVPPNEEYNYRNTPAHDEWIGLDRMHISKMTSWKYHISVYKQNILLFNVGLTRLDKIIVRNSGKAGGNAKAAGDSMNYIQTHALPKIVSALKELLENEGNRYSIIVPESWGFFEGKSSDENYEMLCKNPDHLWKARGIAGMIRSSIKGEYIPDDELLTTQLDNFTFQALTMLPKMSTVRILTKREAKTAEREERERVRRWIPGLAKLQNHFQEMGKAGIPQELLEAPKGCNDLREWNDEGPWIGGTRRNGRRRNNRRAKTRRTKR